MVTVFKLRLLSELHYGISGSMERSKDVEEPTSLSDIQVEKVLICFMKEAINGNLKLIDQDGWEKFEVLRVSAKARLKWGIDMCIQILTNANLKNKNRAKLLEERNTGNVCKTSIIS